MANAGETLAIGVKNYGGTETFTNVATTSYSQTAVLFTTGSTNTSALIYCWKNTGGTGTGTCDDLAVEKISTPANVLTNGGFETGSLSPWIRSGTGANVVPSNARTGTYALQTGASGSGVEQATGGLVVQRHLSAGRLGQGLDRRRAGRRGCEELRRHREFRVPPVRPTPSSPSSSPPGSTNTSAAVYCYKDTGSAAGYCDDYTLIKLS